MAKLRAVPAADPQISLQSSLSPQRVPTEMKPTASGHASQFLDTTSPKISFSLQYWDSPQSLELSQSPFSSSSAGLGSYPSTQPTKQPSESGSYPQMEIGSHVGQLVQVIDPLSFWQNSVKSVAQALLLLAPSDPVQSSPTAAKVTAAKAERKAKIFIFAFF